ncbi:T-lymphoma invasion and metastasis-inducing protein 1 [Austrofundulus limnaeus]|uniref:T-lymphoma invasion and metastasis-inducing protein 1 n=1 Tax=Austrofundulus limnaeus TaxID=52670 RepID=A0A2I4BKB2_AUSLI|nr:PREDICTED: T-lymphoma invasion and metastasis-inducing protein 1 [Austrofundulus limnaeus]XP_013868186.1 PREDICTED: T-lymphoma invasion and metastasis-inducing protein 1 [Austrofundulus limnaeus]
MGNVESQNGDHVLYSNRRGYLSRKHMSRSLRISNKQSRHSPHASSGKMEHRNSETSTRSSSTPSIPQSLADNGLEPFNETNILHDFGSPIWVDRVAMSLRPVSFHNDLANPTVHMNTMHITLPGPTAEELHDEDMYTNEVKYLQKTMDCSKETVSFKKRSKSADTWRDDSLEFSLSDVSQDHLTSTEEIIDMSNERDFNNREGHLQSSPADSADRANSLDELFSNTSPACRQPHGRYAKWHDANRSVRESEDEKMLSPSEEDGNTYGAYTLPCRRSHCLSEGLSSHQTTICTSMQGRRAQTIQDVTAGDGSEYEDSGIDGVMVEAEHQSRRYKTMSASFSVYSVHGRGMFAGSDSGSSGGGGANECVQGVYENFRQELQMSSCQTENLEEASSALSDEQSTMSSAYQSDVLLSVVQGMVRKAGNLAVKNFLVHKKNKKVESATRRKWKNYWVSLKGCTLFFYETDGRSGIDNNSNPKHAVWVENSIVQAVPEHPKKDFVFCLSNSLGDAFLFQTCSQTELENWITAMHSACATAVARLHHREDTVRLLRAEIKKLEQKIDMDEKMKKMGEMQLSAVTDTKKRKTILDQIFLWEQNLEQFHMDLFRFRCYLASLQGGELPNPKRLLAFASRPTKLAMGRLGIFSVSSFHALVAARTETGVRRRTQAMSHSCSKRKSRFSSIWGLDTTSKKKTHRTVSQVFADGEEPEKKPTDSIFIDPVKENSKTEEGTVKNLPQPNTESDIWVPGHLTPSWVCLPNDQPVLTTIQPGESALCVLESICKAHELDPTKHYLRLKLLIENQVQFYIPKPEEDICDLLYKEIEICSKTTKVIQFDRDESCMIGYGFSISVVEEDGIQQLYITDVKAGGLAFAKGLNAGDEILQLNGKDSHNLNFSDMKAAFSQASLALTVNTLPSVDRRQLCYLPPRRSDAADDLYTDIFSQSQEEILDDGVGLLLESSGDSLDDDSESFSEFDERRKSTEQVAAFCRSLHDMNPLECVSSSPSPDSAFPLTATPRQLSDADKLRKVICELVETERTYVKDLNFLIGRYLTPLQKETFLSQDELDVLFGNLPEMVEFQVEFLKTLEDGTRLVPDLEKLESVDQFKKILFSLGGSFLYYADRFKIYSAFCASHTKVPKVLVKAKTDPYFKAFLVERNPKQQHSSTLESYLIKPIQRVLKYPLLLRELYSLTDPDSEEHYHLDVAIKAMNKVASHINEMQKIHEEYGAVFDQLIIEQSSEKKEVADLSMGDLLLHNTVTWINPPASLGKWKKEPQMATFVFKTAVVFVCKEESKQKKKMGGSHRASVSSEEKDPFRFRHMIPTDALQVRPLNNADGESSAMCEIVHTKSESEGRPERTFHLCCSSPESRKDFLKTVHSILREKHRRQLLKTESLPPSQQYVPFGGKRLSALKGARPVINRAASAPTRTLGRRKLVRNRFTIDTDIVFDGDAEHQDFVSPKEFDSKRLQQKDEQEQSELTGDTDRWVEEQFDLDEYEDQEEVKETDILSDDDDEFCQTPRSPSEEGDLESPMMALSLEGSGIEEHKSLNSQNASDDHVKICDMKKGSSEDQNQAEDDEIWVRRELSGSSPDCAT